MANKLSATALSVPIPLTISTKGIKGAGLKKCSPAKRSGRLSAAPMAVIEMDEVLVERIASSSTMLSSETNSDCFAARSSTIASMMSAASASSDTSVATDNLSAAACAASGVRRPLSASLWSCARMPSIADAAAPSRASSNLTGWPATAAICAMPPPIAPAPITATVLDTESGAALIA